mmetsp:Transcript_16875/g.21900  ORF Transcript_16875/g.21900 Transcript_16875/m.21900 type:complete len:455 (-) Transcript_16875:276-1640(-)
MSITQKHQSIFIESHFSIFTSLVGKKQKTVPLLSSMESMFREAGCSNEPTMHYILTDGVPSGGEKDIKEIENLLINGRGPKLHCQPVTFLSCSNNPNDIEWMHESEEISKNVAAIHDFIDEQKDVLNDQGPLFPYSKGLWLLANLVAARDPDGLDAMDQHVPFTKSVLDNLLGRIHSKQEYRAYFISHPTYVGSLISRTSKRKHLKKVFEPDYFYFLRGQVESDIPSVYWFKTCLAKRLKIDIDNNDDNSEAREIIAIETALKVQRNKSYFKIANKALETYIKFQESSQRMTPKQHQNMQKDSRIVPNYLPNHKNDSTKSELSLVKPQDGTNTEVEGVTVIANPIGTVAEEVVNTEDILETMGIPYSSSDNYQYPSTPLGSILPPLPPGNLIRNNNGDDGGGGGGGSCSNMPTHTYNPAAYFPPSAFDDNGLQYNPRGSANQTDTEDCKLCVIM